MDLGLVTESKSFLDYGAQSSILGEVVGGIGKQRWAAGGALTSPSWG